MGNEILSGNGASAHDAVDALENLIPLIWVAQGDTDSAEKVERARNIVLRYRDANLADHGGDAAAERWAIARCIEIVRETRDGFLSEKYAVGQPIASFAERFACDQAASAIENEFGLGTIEQCKLLGKPTPFDVFAQSTPGTPHE